MGNPDLSAENDVPADRSVVSGRGLVVFPAPARFGSRRLVARYAPFLITVALGAVLVVVLAALR